MTCPDVAPDASPNASMDPWAVVPLVTGEQILFGYAVRHPATGGLSWVRTTPIKQLDEIMQRATTASGRQYALGRRVELRDILTEGEEAWLAFNLLIGTAAKDADAVPSIITDPHHDAQWLTACKMARHLGVTAPARAVVAVQDFLTQHITTYAQLRNTGAASLPEQAEVALPADESKFPDLDEIVDTPSKPDPADPARVAARVLLRRALAAAGTTVGEVGRDGSVCLIILSDSVWTKVVRDEWRALIRAGQRYEDGDHDRYRYGYDSGTWVAWVAEEQPRTHALRV